MIYLIVFGLAICTIIKIFQGDINGFFMFAILTGIFLISATIDATYRTFYESMLKLLEKSSDFIKDANEKLKKEIDKKNEENK